MRDIFEVSVNIIVAPEAEPTGKTLVFDANHRLVSCSVTTFTHLMM